MIKLKSVITLLSSIAIGVASWATEKQELQLKYDRPAEHFEETIK